MKALTDEKDQAKAQCNQMAEAQTDPQTEIGRLKAAKERLQQENDQLLRELLAAKASLRPAEPRPMLSASSTNSDPSDIAEDLG